MSDATATPDPSQTMRAIEIYLNHAYGGAGADLPPRVKSQLDVLKGWKGRFYRSPVFAADNVDAPKRYTMRLGNRDYPHMKLSLDLSPDGRRFLFRVDTHDAHACPPADAPEHAAFRAMMDRNQRLSTDIEAAWAAEGLPTFKTYLRDDLARRQNAQEDKERGRGGEGETGS